MRAFVINLVRSPDRRESITDQLEAHGVDYEIVAAVDGRELDLTDPQTISTVAPSFLAAKWFRPGHAACAMSHLSVYRKILDAGLEWALVLEDDVTIPADLAAVAKAVATHLTGAEVALLNFDSAKVCQVSRMDTEELPSGRRLVLPVDAHIPVSAAAYVITREACARIEATAVPIRAKVDDWGHLYDEGAIDLLRCVVPLAVVKDPSFGSTIGYYADTSLKARALALISRYGLRLFAGAVARRRERIWRRYTRVEYVDGPGLNRTRGAAPL